MPLVLSLSRPTAEALLAAACRDGATSPPGSVPCGVFVSSRGGCLRPVRPSFLDAGLVICSGRAVLAHVADALLLNVLTEPRSPGHRRGGDLRLAMGPARVRRAGSGGTPGQRFRTVAAWSSRDARAILARYPNCPACRSPSSCRSSSGRPCASARAESPFPCSRRRCSSPGRPRMAADRLPGSSRRRACSRCNSI
jgi:hypothetical protein